jgi:MoxR-like ATPase
MSGQLDRSELEYRGEHQPGPEARDRYGRRLAPYLPEKGLTEAVNLAIHLQRPLLLRGEPGCGKTRLAQAVAWELGLPFEAWHVKSTSRAAEGLYRYDAVGRLRDAQLAAAVQVGHPTRGIARSRRRADIERYLQDGCIGRAFRADRPTVLLIDEIDKADIDFPNDLLETLDEGQFPIVETGELVVARHLPIIFITSNDEKELPEAFLRRCLFYFVRFPSPARLAAILTAHFGAPPEALVEQAVRRFLELRSRQERDELAAPKKVSTSELIDWFKALVRTPEQSLADLEEGKPWPHSAALIKRREDADVLAAPMSQDGEGP